MGTPDFAVPSLQALAKTHEVVGVVTRPDAPSGRGKTLYPSQVKAAALELGISPVIETKTLRTAEILDRLRALAPDLIVVAAYGAILPPEVLTLPRFGCINVHASLLPRWRGAAPIARAILAGDECAGVCIMQMEEGLDTGAYCKSAQTPVAEKNVDELTGELAQLGARILLEAIEDLERGSVAWTAQDETRVTYADKIDKAEMRLAPQMTAEQACRVVRASADSSPARATVAGKSMRIMDARVATAGPALSQGEVKIEDGLLYLGCAEGVLSVNSIKPDGKGVMETSAWAAGMRGYDPVWSQL